MLREWPGPHCFPGHGCLDPKTSQDLGVALPNGAQSHLTNQKQFLLGGAGNQGYSKRLSHGGDSGRGTKPEDHREQGLSRSHGAAEVTQGRVGRRAWRGRSRSQAAGSFKSLQVHVLKPGAKVPTPGGNTRVGSLVASAVGPSLPPEQSPVPHGDGQQRLFHDAYSLRFIPSLHKFRKAKDRTQLYTFSAV